MFIIFYLTFSCSLLVLHHTSLVERERERGHVHGMRPYLEAFSEKSFPQQTSRIFQSSLLWIHNFFVKCRSLFLLWAWVHSTMEPQVMCTTEKSTHSKNKAKNYYRCAQQQKQNLMHNNPKKRRGMKKNISLRKRWREAHSLWELDVD